MRGPFNSSTSITGTGWLPARYPRAQQKGYIHRLACYSPGPGTPAWWANDSIVSWGWRVAAAAETAPELLQLRPLVAFCLARRGKMHNYVSVCCFFSPLLAAFTLLLSRFVRQMHQQPNATTCWDSSHLLIPPPSPPSLVGS